MLKAGLDLADRTLTKGSNYTTVANTEGLGQSHAGSLMVNSESM